MFLTHSKSIWLWTVCKYIMYCNAGKHFTNSIRSTAKMNFKELPWKEASLLSDKLWHCLWKRRINCFNVIFIVYEIIQGTVNIIVIFKSSIHLKIKIMLQKESSLRKWWTHNRLVKSCNDEVPSTVSIHNKLRKILYSSFRCVSDREFIWFAPQSLLSTQPIKSPSPVLEYGYCRKQWGQFQQNDHVDSLCHLPAAKVLNLTEEKRILSHVLIY